MKNKYAYSTDDESYKGLCDSVEDAILEFISEYGDEYDTVFIGEAHQKTIGDYLSQSSVENMLEQIQERAQDDCGECAEGWLDEPQCPRLKPVINQVFKTSFEQKEEYQLRVDAWMKAKANRLAPLIDGFRIVLETWATDAGEQPKFYRIKNAKEYNCKTMTPLDPAELP